MVQRNSASDCLREPLVDTLPLQCKQLKKGFGECRGWQRIPTIRRQGSVRGRRQGDQWKRAHTHGLARGREREVPGRTGSTEGGADEEGPGRIKHHDQQACWEG